MATSADGFIARPDGDVTWLDRPRPKGNYGMSAFFKSIDTILWGRKTYAKGLEMGMEKGMKAAGFGPQIKNYVFSRHPRESTLPTFEFVNEPVKSFAQRLRAQPGKHIWMTGRRRNHRLLFGPGRNRRVPHPRHPNPHRRRHPPDSASPPLHPPQTPLRQSPPRRRRPPSLPHNASFLTRPPL